MTAWDEAQALSAAAFDKYLEAEKKRLQAKLKKLTDSGLENWLEMPHDAIAEDRAWKARNEKIMGPFTTPGTQTEEGK